MKIKTELVETLHIVTTPENSSRAFDYLMDNGYHPTAWGPPMIKGTMKVDTNKYELTGKKNFQDTSLISRSSRWMVQADHPTLRRIDKFVYTGELSMFIMTLETMNYENIRILSEKRAIS